MTGHRFVAPAIDLAMTVAMVDSMDPALVERLIVVDNTGLKEIARSLTARPVAPTVLTPDGNLGVAGSWNLGCRHAFDDGAVYATIVSTSIRFTPDGGAAVARVADFCVENTQWRWGFESLNGWHLITFSRWLFDEVGWFDETFYPAYFEDSDLIWRLRSAGILEPAGHPRWTRHIPWVPTLEYPSIDTAHTIKNTNITVDLMGLLDYYELKWGGPPGGELWTKPFNGEPHA